MKRQGDTAEIKFLLMSHEKGYVVSKPFGDNCKYDFIVDTGSELQRVQVKSTTRKGYGYKLMRYECTVCSGTDRSKTSYTKKDVDYIAIYIIPINVWYMIPVEEVTVKTIAVYPDDTKNRYRYSKYKI
jgi:hypothetical protein